MGCLGNSIVKTTETVYQLDVLGVCSQPYSSLCDILYLVHAHLSAVSYTLTEEGITAVHVSLHAGNLVGCPWTAASCGSIAAVLVGLHLVILESQLLGHQLAEVWQGTEDADTAGQGSRLCHDISGSHTHIVCA